MAGQLAEAMALAANEGREAVFLDAEEAGPAFALGKDAQPFREQLEFLQQKRPLPSKYWTEVLQNQHDRAFVVAGVTDLAMVEEFQAAILSAVESGTGIEIFAKEFDRLVEAYGWDYNGERNWRIRTIFETNIRTSYMAGRLRQMRDPDVVKGLPYWQYIHGDTRVPKSPRKQHLGWNGLVLRWDDPWWNTHFPPNDWLCSCGVRARSERWLQKQGKTGPDQAPQDALIPVIDPASGQMVMKPTGIGLGWDYMPGDHWSRDLVPSRLIEEAKGTTGDPKRLVSIDTPGPLADLYARARPFKAAILPKGLSNEDYIAAFLQPFGLAPGQAKLWRDAAGDLILISEQILFDRKGAWKGDKRGHADHAALLAETIMDPDEIWLGVREIEVNEKTGQTDVTVTRRYLRGDSNNAIITLFEMGRKYFSAVTGYGSRPKDKPNVNYLDGQRVGKLLWPKK